MRPGALIIAFIILPVVAFTQLPSNPYNHGHIRNSELIAEDSEGGFYNIRLDNYAGSDNFIQRVDASGNILWTKEYFHNNSNASRRLRTIASDNNGDIFVLASSELVAAQYFIWKLDKNGNHLWDEDGVEITTSTPDTHRTELVPNNEGGVFFGWARTYGTFGDFVQHLHVQQLNANGEKKWGADGVRVGFEGGNVAMSPDMFTADGSGGGYLTWTTELQTSTTRVFVQHIGPTGQLLWGAAGKQLINYSGFVMYSSIVRNAFDEIFVTWTHEVDLKGQVFGQKLNNAGNTLWAEPKQLTFYRENNHSQGGTGSRYVVPANDGGLFILHSERWLNTRLTRVNRDGVSVWDVNGKRISDAGGIFGISIREYDNEVYLGWLEASEHSYSPSLPQTVFAVAQKMDYNGNRLWGNNGVQLCNVISQNVNGSFWTFRRLAIDKQGGVFVAWRDVHLTEGWENSHAFNKVNDDGTLGNLTDVPPVSPGIIAGVTESCLGQQTFSVNENPGITVNWSIVYRKHSEWVFIETLNLGNGFSIQYDFQKIGHYVLFAVPRGTNGQYGPASYIQIDVNASAVASVIQGYDRSCLKDVMPQYFVQAPDINFNWSVTGGTIMETVGQRITVQWDNVAQGVVKATPTNGCFTGIASVKNVELVPVFTPSEINAPALICAGNPATYSVEPIAGASYMWSTSTGTFATPSSSLNPSILFPEGEHQLQLTAYVNGCYTATRTKNINPLPRPARPSVSPTSFETCSDEPVALTASGGFSAYEWNTGAITQNISVSEAGLFTVKVRGANGCWSPASNNTVGISHAAPAAVITRNGNTLTSSIGTSYDWYLNGMSLNKHTQSIVVKDLGLYTVVVTNTFGCDTESEDYTVVITGVETAGNDNFMPYPNPVKSMLRIDRDGQKIKMVVVTNMLGASVRTFHHGFEAMNVIDLAPGKYIVLVHTRDGVAAHQILKFD